MGHSTVMLSAAKHLAAQRDRPFAALRGTKELCHAEHIRFAQCKLWRSISLPI